MSETCFVKNCNKIRKYVFHIRTLLVGDPYRELNLEIQKARIKTNCIL